MNGVDFIIKEIDLEWVVIVYREEIKNWFVIGVFIGVKDLIDMVIVVVF